MTRKRTTSLVLLLVVGVFAGCQTVQTTAAHKIADSLTRTLGPAQHYDVNVEGDALALARGRARRIHIVGQQVQVAPDTTLDTLDIDAHDVSFDPKARRLQKAGQVSFAGTVRQQNLTRYLKVHNTALPDLSVTLRDADVLVLLPISALSLYMRAAVSGTLVPDADQPDHLDFVANAASLGRLNVPARLVNGALGLVNPVFDLSHVKVPITVTQAGVTGGQVVLQGTANLDNFQSS